MHHSHDAIERALDADEARQRAIPRRTPVPVVGLVTIDLNEGDTAWNPASTKRDLVGPVRVIYRRFPDGGIDVDRHALQSTATRATSWHATRPAVDYNAR